MSEQKPIQSSGKQSIAVETVNSSNLNTGHLNQFIGDITITSNGSVQLNLANGSAFSARQEDWANFTDLIARVTHGFTGREFIFQALTEFIAHNSRGYFRITAEAGLGKTAIAAELAKRYLAPACFISVGEGRTQPERVLNILSTQVIARYGLPHITLPPSAGETSDWFYERLKEAANFSDDPVVVVIDAIDEADSTPPGHNWLHLPSDLPEGVYTVLIHRPGDYPLTTVPNLQVDEFVITWSDPKQQADIEAHLRQQAQSPEIQRALENATPPVDTERFVAALREASQGNFMYLQYVLNDIAAYEQDLTPLDLKKLPQGLKGYYTQFWSQLEAARKTEGWSDWDKLYRPVIALLGAAREPIPEKWLANHINREQEEIRERVLVPWRRFLSREQNNSRETWHIIHQSFADFLQEKIDLVRTHRSIAEYYLAERSRWKEFDGYAFRHLSTHLAQANLLNELGHLIEDCKWLKAQQEYNPTFQSYAADIERALKMAQAHALNRLPQLVAWNLLYATLRSQATNIPIAALKTLLKLGDINQVLCYTELDCEARKRVQLYIDVGLYLYLDGHKPRTEQVLNLALEAAVSIKELDEQSRKLCDLTLAFAEVGVRAGLARLQIIAESFKEREHRIRLFGVLAFSYTKTNQVDKAQDLIDLALVEFENVEDALQKSELLKVLGLLLSFIQNENQHFYEVILNIQELVKDIQEQGQYAQALSNIAVAFAQIDKKEQAHNTFNSALEIVEKIEVWASFCSALGNVCQAFSWIYSERSLKQALKLVKRVKSGFTIAHILGAIAKGIATENKEEGLALILEFLRDDEIQKYLNEQPGDLSDIAEGLAQIEDKNGISFLLYITRSMPESIITYSRSKSLCAIAKAKAQLSEFEDAIALTEEIIKKSTYVNALSEISYFIIQSGSIKQGKSILNRALAVAKKIEYGEENAQMLYDFAVILIKRRKVKEGQKLIIKTLDLIKDIDNQFFSATLVRNIAQTLAAVEDRETLESVLSTARKIKNHHDNTEKRDWALEGTSEAFARLGDFEYALEVAKEIEGRPARIRAFCNLAVLLRSRNIVWAKSIFADAKALVSEIHDFYFGYGDSWALVVSDIAFASAQIEEANEVDSLLSWSIELARSIGDDWFCAKALIGITHQLIQIGNTNFIEWLVDLLEITETIQVIQWKVLALVEIGGELAKAGKVNEYQNLIQQALILLTIGDLFETDWQCSQSLNNILSVIKNNIEHTSKVHQFLEEIIDIVQSRYQNIKNNKNYTYTKDSFEKDYTQVIIFLIEVINYLKDKSQARQFLYRSKCLIDTIKNDKWRAIATGEWVLSMAQIEESKQAHLLVEQVQEMIDKVDSEEICALVLCKIAKAFFHIGEVSNARSTLCLALNKAEKVEDNVCWFKPGNEVRKEVVQLIQQVSFAEDTEVAQWIAAAFQSARNRGRSAVFQHISIFAEILDKLNCAETTLEYIQTIEMLLIEATQKQ